MGLLPSVICWVCFTLFFSLDWVCFTICCLGLMLAFFSLVGLLYYNFFSFSFFLLESRIN